MGGLAFSTPVLRFVRVVKTYGARRVVDDVTLSVKAGEFAALAGVNGSGKSTLFNIAMGLTEPASGDVEFADEGSAVSLLSREPSQRARMGLAYIPQDRRILCGMSSLDNLRIGRAIENARIFDVLGKLRLTCILDKHPAEMSRTDALWLHVARAFLSNPRFLIVDEPFSGLSHQEIRHCLRILRMMCAAGSGVLLTDHNAAALLHCADAVHIIQDGRIVYADSAERARVSAEAKRLYFRTRA